MVIKRLLNKLVGVTDIKQSIAWFGTVGIAIGITVVIYIRLGQYITINETRATEERTEIERIKAMIEPWNEQTNGSVVYPRDVKKELLRFEEEMSERLDAIERRLDK